MTATCVTRRLANNMHTKPVAKSVRMAFFLLRGICRFQVRLIGKAITVVLVSQS